MKNWTRRHTLIAGMALIMLTNAVALLGVYRNRSGEPESMLKLTQRELQQPQAWEINRENSGVTLRINWRVPSAEKSWNYSYSGGSPAWLDQAKMASLGFDVGPPASMLDNQGRSVRQLGKEVLLVLELDGPAYRQALQRAQQNATEQVAKLAALPDDKAMKDNAKRAQDDARREEQDNSRLFAVDAGLNLAGLRARYPDRGRYAIVRALVRPQVIAGKSKLAGYIDRIGIDEIHVPREYHATFEGGPRRTHGAPAKQSFEASVAFGQRLEPWLLGISASKN